MQYEAPAQYEFAYEVNDEYTGDIKSQKESRNGDQVVGQYMLVDADGYRRIVDYSADDKTGFNALVRREPLESQKVVKSYSPVAAAPILIQGSLIPSPYIRVQKSVAPSYNLKQNLFTPADVNVAPVIAGSQKQFTQVTYSSAQKAAYDQDASNSVNFSGSNYNYKY